METHVRGRWTTAGALTGALAVAVVVTGSTTAWLDTEPRSGTIHRYATGSFGWSLEHGAGYTLTGSS